MKNAIVITLTLLCASGHADIFSELTGDAARRRTSEAREKRDAMRAQVAQLNRLVEAKRQEIAQQQGLITNEIQNARTLRQTLVTMIQKEVARLDQQINAQAALNETLAKVSGSMQRFERDMQGFSSAAVRVVATAQAMVKMSDAVQSNPPGALAWKMAYGRTYVDVTKAQVVLLNELATTQNDQPAAVDYLGTVGRQLLTSVDVPALKEARRQTGELRQGLMMQTEQTTSLLEASRKIQLSYQQMLKGLETTP